MKTITIDGNFPGLKDNELESLLEKGWFIIDKTVLKERYIRYVLKEHDEYYGKQSS